MAARKGEKELKAFFELDVRTIRRHSKATLSLSRKRIVFFSRRSSFNQKCSNKVQVSLVICVGYVPGKLLPENTKTGDFRLKIDDFMLKIVDFMLKIDDFMLKIV